MPGQDLFLDDDGDYVPDGKGSFVTTSTASPSIRHQLLDLVSEWVGDTGAGRDRRSIAGRNSSQAEADIEADGILNALAPLQADGLIDDIAVSVNRQGSRWIVSVQCRDTQSGGTINFDNQQSFGV